MIIEFIIYLGSSIYLYPYMHCIGFDLHLLSSGVTRPEAVESPRW